MIVPMIEANIKKAFTYLSSWTCPFCGPWSPEGWECSSPWYFPSCYWSYSAFEQGSAHPQLNHTAGNDSLSEQTREDPDNIEKIANWNCLFKFICMWLPNEWILIKSSYLTHFLICDVKKVVDIFCVTSPALDMVKPRAIMHW